MDITKLQSILMARGIRVSDNDPVFTLVALNEVMLEEMSRKHQLAFRDIDKKVIGELSGIVNQTVNQIARKEAEARVVMADAKKIGWVVGGVLAGLAVFGLGVTYGVIYATWRVPAWIKHGGIFSELTSSLMRAPVGGVGFFVIALTLFLLQRSISDSISENEADEIAMKIFVNLFAAIFAAMGAWLSFLVMFK